jgi:hypothetical protein
LTFTTNHRYGLADGDAYSDDTFRVNPERVTSTPESYEAVSDSPNTRGPASDGLGVGSSAGGTVSAGADAAAVEGCVFLSLSRELITAKPVAATAMITAAADPMMTALVLGFFGG